MANTSQNTKTGDAAVDGLIAGITAGILMGIYLLLAGLLSGKSLSDTLGSFAPGEPVSPLVGLLSHLAVSAIYGTVYGIFTLPLANRLPGWLMGVTYGVILFLVAQYILLPGMESPMMRIAPFHLGAAHILYGAILGLQTHRQME